jgi:hypothetical protein
VWIEADQVYAQYFRPAVEHCDTLVAAELEARQRSDAAHAERMRARTLGQAPRASTAPDENAPGRTVGAKSKSPSWERHPSCRVDNVEFDTWKRVRGRLEAVTTSGGPATLYFLPQRICIVFDQGRHFLRAPQNVRYCVDEAKRIG